MGRVLASRAEALALGAVGLFALVLVGLPLGWLLVRAAGSGPAEVAFADAAPLLGRSLLGAAVVGTLATAIGGVLGVLLGRSDVPWARLALAIHGFPALLPPLIGALGLFRLLGAVGVARAGDLPTLVTLLLATTPIATLLAARAAAGLDASLVDTARVAAAPLAVLGRIVLPAVLPAAALGGVLAFALALGDATVPLFFRSEAWAAVVFSRLGGLDPDAGAAAVLALPMVLFAVILAGLLRRWTAARALPLLSPAAAPRLPLGSRRPLVAVLAWGVVLGGVAPLAALAPSAAAGLPELGSWLGSAPLVSVGVALGASGLVAIPAVILGHALARGRPIAAAIDTLALVGFLVPGAALALGLVATWNHSSTRVVYGSLAILVIAAAARVFGVASRAASVAIAGAPASLEEVAATAGAGFARRLALVVMPASRPGLVAAWVLATATALRDLDVAAAIYPPGGQPLAVRMFTLEANGPEDVVAALAALQVALTVAVLAVGAWGMRR